MKHFLPSSVMLTPFLVKYYDEELEDTPNSEESQAPQTECSDNSEKSSILAEIEPTFSE
ncbi:conserved hypothetical protein [Vibrio crassostreae]|uniref:hypothetical protein n=1 Tax=Vibrio crassostreae TaxID=246167 RepID=UPI001B316DFD|nr:hypothetical protein [Vibrio crassostreae]CAK1696585.1 conserved hypothetical protein [Vibrio crassostreae]CAK1704905.1 conserved hypothetical protein [Vibrio crassostreae]CAK1713371.1 conserved hypothetical protein [Vibrio crassostreae]CAK1714377.1 conserved hypothetical protein [Vibrio crassostreae]CAK1716691.1 conserved hypothetical protein [Vibrio crassostreae]